MKCQKDTSFRNVWVMPRIVFSLGELQAINPFRHLQDSDTMLALPPGPVELLLQRIGMEMQILSLIASLKGVSLASSLLPILSPTSPLPHFYTRKEKVSQHSSFTSF